MFEWDQTSTLTEHFIKEYDENSNTGYFLKIDKKHTTQLVQKQVNLKNVFVF